MFVSRRPELHAANRRWSARMAAQVLLLAVLWLLLPVLAPAQDSTYGALAGTMSGAADHAAGITVRSLESGVVESTPVRADGTFLFPRLAPGAYVLLSRPGAEVRIEIAAGETLTLDRSAGLVPGLPASSQPATALLRPDQAPQPSPDQDADGLTSVGGLPSTQNTTLVDGASATQNFTAEPLGSGSDSAPDADDDSDSAEQTTGPTHGLGRGRHAGAAYVFSAASIREFRPNPQGYSAQVGAAAGAVETANTRGGTPTPHGLLFFQARSSAFAAAEPLAIASTYAGGLVSATRVKPLDLRLRFGGAVGGPLAPARRHLFGFFTLDAQRRNFPAVSSPADPDFYVLSATQTALLANRGVSPRQTDAALVYLASLTGTVPRRADQTIEFGRVDWLAHPRFSPALSYNRLRWTAPAGLLEAPVVARGRASLGTAAGSVDDVLLRVASGFTPRTLNQLHVAWLRDLQFESPQPPLAQEPAIGPGGLVPEVNIGPQGLLFGTPAGLAQRAFPDERRFEVGDALTLVRGRHALVFGGTLAFVHDRVATVQNAAGTFLYDSGGTRGSAGGLVDFITDQTYNVNTNPNGGCPAITAADHLFCFQSFSQSFAPAAAFTVFSTQNDTAFAQDTWRMREHLTLSAGVRYEYTLLPVPQTPNPTLDAIFGARGASSVFPEDRNNFGPRAAVAWQTSGFTVRAGYGLFFGRLPGATVRQALAETALPTSTTRIRITPAAVTNCPQVANQGFGYPCAFLQRPSGVVGTTASAVVFDRHFRLPAVQQGSLTLEHGLGRLGSISAGYVLNLDRQLPGSTDLNIAPSTSSITYQLQGGTGAAGVRDGESFSLPLYTARLSPAFGPVTDLVSHANGTYHALVLRAAAKPAPGLLVRADYTWSKALDDAPSLGATPRTDSQLDPYLDGYDKGISALNRVWSTRVALTWEPSAYHAADLRGRLVDGLIRNTRVTPVFSAHAGRPYSLDTFGGTALAGGHLSLNGSGGALYLPTVGRDTLRLPATAVLDLRLARTFHPGARVRLQAAAEAFNLLNREQISAVNARAFLRGTPANGVTPLLFQSAAAIAAEGLNTTSFGTPTAASAETARARQVQFELRLEF